LIGGPTCSGKTTLARAIATALPTGACSIITLDSYYRDLEHVPFEARATHNFDHPDSIDWELVTKHAEILARGEPVDAPEYDFASHGRRARAVTVVPAPIIMIEGLLALHDRNLRVLADLRIFMHVDDATCLARRILRDTEERGRTEASIAAQYAATVRPMAERFILPTRVYADLDLNGAVQLGTLVDYVMEWLPQPPER